MNDDKCVCCGAYIPEGRQVCAYCEKEAIEALHEKAERDKGCPWCKAEYTIIDDDFGQPISPKMIRFCWKCGKRLEDEYEHMDV